MLDRSWKYFFCVVLCVAWGGSSVGASGPAGDSAVERDVRTFVGAVAHDITQEGPNAWRRYFSDRPAFFMASEGLLVFPDSASATAGIQKFASTIDHMELRWGDDLRIDVLTPRLAVVGASYREIRVDTAKNTVDERGFFTGIAEYRKGHWQFRDAHWSTVRAPAAAR